MTMSPLDINTAARQRYNAVGDDFWSDTEIYGIIYQGCLEMVSEGLVIEQTYSTVSVALQQEYSFPTQAINIKRVTYNGRKLTPMSFREDDVLTVLNQTIATTGIPSSYVIWNNILYLRDIPATAGLAIKIWSNITPQSVTATSTLEFPRGFEMAVVNLILSEMSAKNKNYAGMTQYRTLWEADVKRAKKLQRRKKIGDAFNFVKNVDMLHQSDLGNI